MIRTVDGLTEKLCKKCGAWWPLTREYFYGRYNAHGVYTLYSPCRDCVEEHKVESFETKPCCIPGCNNPRYAPSWARCWQHRYRSSYVPKGKGETVR
jgi:hypothetical protein